MIDGLVASPGATTEVPSTTAQRALETLGRIHDADLEQIVDLLGGICDVEMAAVTILAGQECHYLATVGFEPMVVQRDDSFCAYVIDVDDSVVVPDTRLDDRFRTNPYVDGTTMSLRFYASAPLRAPDGAAVGRLCVFAPEPRNLNPVQEQALSTLATNLSRILELRMRRDDDAAPRLSDAMDEALRVAAQISHDMRIPLTALTAGLDMIHDLETGDPDPLRTRLFSTTRNAARRLDLMVEGLLGLHEAGRRVDLEDVDLFRVAQQVVADSGPLLTRANAAIDIAALPVVRADSGGLYSVFLNLLSNAVKFTRPGVLPFIEITSAPIEGGWRISVIDNGIGIPPERRNDVFSMFMRLDSGVEGHGIGLATVYRIIEAHGGRVGIADGSEGGTEMWFELPAVPV